MRINEFGQPIGDAVPPSPPPPTPPREPMRGHWCVLDPLDPARHAEGLWEADLADPEGRTYTYLPYGPFGSLAEHRAWLEDVATRDDPLFFTIIPTASGAPAGVAAFMRIDTVARSVEVGHVHFAPALSRTPAATEAMHLMMRRAFELGYRRYEWKCDSLNAPSRTAAQRLGFSFEGVFRKAHIVKGRTRDTAWFAATDDEWPALRDAFVAWLDPANFDEHGRQRTRLSDLTRPHLVATDPTLRSPAPSA